MSPQTSKQQSAERTTAKRKAAQGLTPEERAAMKERGKELKAAKDKADGESDVLARIADMQDSDRVMAERLHEIITATAPDLTPRTWYGMPAYAKDGEVQRRGIRRRYGLRRADRCPRDDAASAV